MNSLQWVASLSALQKLRLPSQYVNTFMFVFCPHAWIQHDSSTDCKNYWCDFCNSETTPWSFCQFLQHRIPARLCISSDLQYNPPVVILQINNDRARKYLLMKGYVHYTILSKGLRGLGSLILEGRKAQQAPVKRVNPLNIICISWANHFLFLDFSIFPSICLLGLELSEMDISLNNKISSTYWIIRIHNHCTQSF